LRQQGVAIISASPRKSLIPLETAGKSISIIGPKLSGKVSSEVVRLSPPPRFYADLPDATAHGPGPPPENLDGKPSRVRFPRTCFFP